MLIVEILGSALIIIRALISLSLERIIFSVFIATGIGLTNFMYKYRFINHNETYILLGSGFVKYPYNLDGDKFVIGRIGNKFLLFNYYTSFRRFIV